MEALTEPGPASKPMRATPAPPRAQEVTRTVHLSAPDALDRRTPSTTTTTPHQAQRTTWSGPLEALLGYSPADASAGNEAWWLARIHPADRARVLASLAAHLAPAPERPFAAPARIWGCDYRFRSAGGAFVALSERAVTGRGGGGYAVGMEGVVFGTEERRGEREAFRRGVEGRDWLAVVADNTPSGIFMMDPLGYCIFMNAAAEQITGFTFREIYDYTFHASVHSCRPNGDPFPLHECPVYGHQQKGTAAKNEAEIFVHKDGHHYDIEYSVSPIGNYASGGAVIEFRDVTEQKRIEKERLNAVLMTEQQSVRIKADDVHKSNMTSFVSFICHEIRNPLQGVTSSAEFLLESLQKLATITEDLATAKNDVSNHDSVRARKGLTPPESNTDGKASDSSLQSPSLDTTVGSFDRNKLVEMEGLIAQAKQLVGNIQVCAEHQALITNNVLDLSRLDAGKMEPSFDVVDIQTLGQETVGMMCSKAQRKHITLSLDPSKSRPLYLKTDATILRQILLNLVSNAIKFTPDHGTITIKMYADPPRDDGQVTLHGSVTDNGLGMSSLEQERIFQRFSQANRRVAQLYGGSGLGLSITKELVKVLGGKMHVESTQGKGSTFSFDALHYPPTEEELSTFLPKSKILHSKVPPAGCLDDATKPPAEPDTHHPPPKFRMIGVAEDNPINLQYLAKHLKKLGYRYTLCTNGKEILDKFCAPDSLIDCCILDMSMPIMDGLESARLMRQYESSLVAPNKPRSLMPIIALSGNALTEQVSVALAAGINDYLTKPCTHADLARTLSHWEYVVHTSGGDEALSIRPGTAP